MKFSSDTFDNQNTVGEKLMNKTNKHQKQK